MKIKSKIIGFIATALILLTVSSCHKDEASGRPSIAVTVKPESGNTTQTFTFDLSASQSGINRGKKVFTRWDWDGDGNWDTPFTRLEIYTHRYRKAGNWVTRVEMTNLDGGTDTMSLVMPVVQGFSPPRPDLKMIPATGHIFTNFLLDASGTIDDEDSLDLLKIRWDFEGDGIWDTSYGDSVSIHHVYPYTGPYTPAVQVRDPSGLSAIVKKQLFVTMEDPELVASFRCLPDSVTDHTEIIMDASASYDPYNRDRPLHYRWDWDNDRMWDTEWLSDPKTVHVFETEYFHFVRLQVRSSRGLTNEITIKIRVYHKNRPPRAFFAASTLTGNVNTDFRFDCWATSDMESSPTQLKYRWDFDGDGTWDTGFPGEVITWHRFDTPGTYRTLLEVQDPSGATDTISRVIHISHGSNPTGTFEDMRGMYQTYGTVRIGDQWWFSRNLSFGDTAKYYQYSYENDWPSYFEYGFLYTGSNSSCPPGWRVPTKDDWEKLFSNYPEDELYEALMPGGVSDFGANLGGQGIGLTVNTAIYKEKDQVGYYWSSTKPLEYTSISLWIVTFDKDSRKILKGFDTPTKKWYSIRCVKDAI